MKKILAACLSVAGIVAATSCGNTKLSEEQDKNYRLNDSLQVALANADSMFSVLYDVTTGLEQISQLEHLVQAQVTAENPSARQDIEAQMVAIQKGLIERRKRIEQLESQLGSKAGENSKLRKQLDALRSQIDGQAATVAELTEKLNAAHFRIEVLVDSVSGLKADIDTIAAEKAMAEAATVKAINDLNTIYYVIGTNKELKQHEFISGGGFLRKTKVLEGDFDRSYMTPADRRNLTTIPTDAPDAKILTSQPKDSYRFEKTASGNLNLVITDASRFWATSNLLVIEVKN